MLDEPLVIVDDFGWRYASLWRSMRSHAAVRFSTRHRQRTIKRCLRNP